MPRSRLLLPACLMATWMLALPVSAAVQTPPPAPQGAAAPPGAPPLPPDEEADHEALRRLKDVYEQAVNGNQLDLLAPHLHPDFFGVMITNEHVRNVDEMRAYWQRIQALIGEGGRYTTTLNPERSVILGDLALARGTSDDLVVTDEGQEYRFTSSWTVVCQRQGGQWKVLRAQGTIDPVQNEFVRTFMRRAAVQAALVGGLAGVALGWLVAILFRRIRTRKA